MHDIEAAAAAVGATPAVDPPKVTCVSSAVSRAQWRQEQQEQDDEGATSKSFTFRALTEQDLPAVMALHRDLFPVQYNNSFYDKLFTDGYFCLVGVDRAGEVVSVATARTVEYTPTALPTTEAYIMTLGVSLRHRRHGLGVRQMEAMLKLLRAQTRCTHVALHVKSANRAACAFYDRLGFKCDADGGLLPNHYFLHGQYWDARRYTRPLVGPLHALLRDLYSDGCAVL